VVPPGATCQPSDYLSTSDDFIFDVQTHCFDQGEWRTNGVTYPQYLTQLARGRSWCPGVASPLDCFDPEYYAELMFVDSDTTMSVITSWPAASCFPERQLLGNAPIGCGLPLSNAGMRNLRDWINQRAMSQRCINQVQVMPNDFIEHQIEGMYAAIEDPHWKCGSWKAYPAWTSDTFVSANGYAQGYFLTDPVGRAFIEAGLKLGVPNFAIHKGLPIPGFDVLHNEPSDVGPAALDYPQANFVIYHSAINAGTGGTVQSALSPQQTESVPYDPKDPNPLGVNQLIRSLITSGVIHDPDNPDPSKKLPARLNVFAEMGSAWIQVMADTNASQHYIGKLLKYLGPNNIVWGTDCILYGSPQVQIDLFKAFTITPQYQDKYGYPAITDAMKKQIFGLNAAALYRVDPTAARCKVSTSTFARLKLDLDENLGPRRWTQKTPLGPRTYDEYRAHARLQATKRVPG
jgi:predicted TIM-barrel fold metal-dependent hydrolase